jgi:hypothetical protein
MRGDSDDSGSMDDDAEVKDQGSTNCITQVLDEEGDLLVMFDRQFDRYRQCSLSVALNTPCESLLTCACVRATLPLSEVSLAPLPVAPLPHGKQHHSQLCWGETMLEEARG